MQSFRCVFVILQFPAWLGRRASPSLTLEEDDGPSSLIADRQKYNYYDDAIDEIVVFGDDTTDEAWDDPDDEENIEESPGNETTDPTGGLVYENHCDVEQFSELPLATGLTPFTVAMSVVFPENGTSERQTMLILGQEGTGSFHILYHPGTLQIGVWNGGKDAQFQGVRIPGSTLVLAISYDGDAMKLYMGDGVPPLTRNHNALNLTNTFLTVKKDSEAGKAFTGVINHVSVWNRGLSNDEMIAINNHYWEAQMVRDEEHDGLKCGRRNDPHRVFKLRGANATEEACSSACLQNVACVAYAAQLGRWCVGCSKDPFSGVLRVKAYDKRTTTATGAQGEQMVRDEDRDGMKCGRHRPLDRHRVFDLRGENATKEACSSACLQDSACVAFSGRLGKWCAGCSKGLFLGIRPRRVKAYKKSTP